MATQSFSATVAEWVRQTQRRLEIVARQSASDVIEEMTRPGWSVASAGKEIEKGLGYKGRGQGRLAIQGPINVTHGGGNLPINTGYLRASLQVTTSAPVPIDPSARPVEGQTYELDDYSLAIAGWELGKPLYATFTAAYAAAVEYGSHGREGRAFVRLAAQRWQSIVDANVEKVRSMTDV